MISKRNENGTFPKNGAPIFKVNIFFFNSSLVFIKSRYPEGIPLITVFVHPSMVEMDALLLNVVVGKGMT
jgi:hypothetical protein